MSSSKERPYTVDDLTDLNTAALSDIIRSQIAKWPDVSGSLMGTKKVLNGSLEDTGSHKMGVKGYQGFQANQNKKLTNKSRIDFWRFAAEFSAQYYNKNSGAAGRIGKAVKKASIETALSMAATSLDEAEKMVKLVAKFGGGGERRAQEVVNRIGSDAIDGRELSQLLVNWDKSHPV
ncbi:hypothetical protein B0H17DRAFT_1200559 [Mycena rosella]|uniref:Uncharacterized protein n=1 Tax=Mycena rosella TaxID=1033263 RepID=A0AAD7DIT2_MYCRO|nr:hypothetical protein B0H17DRAFT_1200559 [Mycena rosella]